MRWRAFILASTVWIALALSGCPEPGGPVLPVAREDGGVTDAAEDAADDAAEDAAEDAAPEDAAPEDAAPEDTASQDLVAGDVSGQDILEDAGNED